MTSHVLINQNTPAPTMKMKYVGYGAIGATFVMTFVALKYPDAHKMIPPGFEVAVGSAIAGLIAFAAGYFKRERA